MSYSMKQIADITNVSKQTVYRYIKKNHIEPETIGANNVQMFSSEVLSKIQQEYSSSTSSNKTTNSSSDTNAQLEALQKQLDVKDEQIAELHRLLDQQQRLNLSTANLLEQSTNKPQSTNSDPQEHSESSQGHSSNSEDSENLHPTKKRHWWDRLTK